MIYTHTAVAIVAGALAFWGGWQVQGWRLNGQIAVMKTKQVEATATAVREARATESRRYQEVFDAQAKAATRTQTSRTASTAAAASGNRLRDDLAASLRASQESAAACNQHATTLSGLLDQCSTSYRGMAENAQGHANDVTLLLESWPK